MLSRIAPTPSGFLHLGNAASFLLTAAIVKAHGGQLLLRIDDMDSQRLRPDYVENILATLDHLGVQPDLGPQSLVELQREWSQHHRLPLYQEALQKLAATGLVYACDCSRKRLKSLPQAVYDGYCRDRKLPLLPQAGLAWRIRLPEEAVFSLPEYFMDSAPKIDLAQAMGDFVVRKKDGMPAYQLSSVVDDLHFGLTHIVRGEDLLASSVAQLYLLQLLEEPITWRFYHHPLLLDAAGEKLSKSAGAQALLDHGGETIERVAVRAVVDDWLAASRLGETELMAIKACL